MFHFYVPIFSYIRHLCLFDFVCVCLILFVFMCVCLFVEASICSCLIVCVCVCLFDVVCFLFATMCSNWSTKVYSGLKHLCTMETMMSTELRRVDVTQVVTGLAP